MKYLFIILIVSFNFYFMSCNVLHEDSESENDIDTVLQISEKLQITIVDTIIEKDTLLFDKYNYLHKIFIKEDSLYTEFEEYLSLLEVNISSEKQIKEVFTLRDKLRNFASLKVDKFYYEKGETNETLWTNVEKELISIGYLPVYTEGMYVDLTYAPILGDAMKKYASEAFNLKINFDNEYSKCVGGEYPYSNLSEYFDAFELGYKLFNKYKDTEYYEAIKETFQSIIIEFVDIHKIKDECYEGGLHYGFYPWVTNCDIPELFVKRFPNTVFTPVFKKLINNMSEFNPKQSIYLVITDTINNENKYIGSTDKLITYLEKGIDIVHAIDFKNKQGKDIRCLAFRFYSNENKAEEALIEILNKSTNAKIITVIMDDKGAVKEI